MHSLTLQSPISKRIMRECRLIHCSKFSMKIRLLDQVIGHFKHKINHYHNCLCIAGGELTPSVLLWTVFMNDALNEGYCDVVIYCVLASSNGKIIFGNSTKLHIHSSKSLQSAHTLDMITCFSSNIFNLLKCCCRTHEWSVSLHAKPHMLGVCVGPV